MLIRLWGVRGSLPSPMLNREYRKKLRAILSLWQSSPHSRSGDSEAFLRQLPPELGWTAGGDSTCISLQTSRDRIYIIDCGSGMRSLGRELLGGLAAQGKAELSIFLTHTHWDHINGLPFFPPLYIPGNRLRFYSPRNDIEACLVQQQSEPYFPAPFEKTLATKEFIEMPWGESIQLEEDLFVDFYPLRHPGGSYAYRFRQGRHSFIFATDCEFTGEDLENREQDWSFFEDTDLLFLDCQYTLDESFSRFDWGHTSYTMGVNCSLRWRVRNLMMTHHEPTYSDARLAENLSAAIEHRKLLTDKERPKIHLAREGMRILLGRRPE